MPSIPSDASCPACRLARRSSKLPSTGHLPRESLTGTIRLAGQVPSRRYASIQPSGRTACFARFSTHWPSFTSALASHSPSWPSAASRPHLRLVPFAGPTPCPASSGSPSQLGLSWRVPSSSGARCHARRLPTRSRAGQLGSSVHRATRWSCGFRRGRWLRCRQPRALWSSRAAQRSSVSPVSRGDVRAPSTVAQHLRTPGRT